MMKNILALLLILVLTGPALAQEANIERSVPAQRQQLELSFSPLVKQAAPAVVNIYSKRTVTRRVSPFIDDPFFRHFFGGSFGMGGGLSRQRVESALGSGVIVDGDEALVVTNTHVVRGSEAITVVLADGREFEAEIVLTDEPSDLALLRIDPDGEQLPAVVLRPSESLEVGDLVLAIGNPFGVGQTVTSGIVSALARSTLNINDFNFFIQTDAAINPGNSGGALVAMDGGLVGINTAIYSQSGGSLGIGFAIPSEMVATVIAAAKAGQSGGRAIIRPWLGISAQQVTADIAESLGLRTPHGVLVADLHQRSPARAAGLASGDLVTAVNGRDVRDPAEMKFRMATVPIGDQAVFTINRRGQSRDLKVAAIAPPDDPPRRETALKGFHPLDGATVGLINPAVEVELGIGESVGVVVLSVEPGSSATRLVRPGDIIAAVNGKNIENIDNLTQILSAGSGRGWDLILSRGGSQRRLSIR